MRTSTLLMALALVAGACAADDSRTISSEASSAAAPSDGAGTSSTPDGLSQSGDTAVWSIEGDDPPTPSTEAFTASVSRLGCSGGRSGEVLPPDVSMKEDEIVVTFTVESLPEGAYTCQGNPSVPYLVDVGEPVGDRDLVDGACLSGGAATTSFCSEGAVRWSP